MTIERRRVQRSCLRFAVGEGFALRLGTFLVVYNNLVSLVRLPVEATLSCHALVSAILTVSMKRRGLARQAIGLNRNSILSGIRWGGAASLGMIGLVLVGARAGLVGEDRRVAGLSNDELAVRVLAWIPFGVAFFEEFAFRGVFFYVLTQDRSLRAATTVSSIVFGLWHVVPELHRVRSESSEDIVSRLPVGVLFTGVVAGPFLCWLRVRTDGIWAPMIVHATTNASLSLAASLRRGA